MHRDEATYARGDARGITLTDDEANLALWAIRAARGWPSGLDWDAVIALSEARQALADRLEAELRTRG